MIFMAWSFQVYGQTTIHGNRLIATSSETNWSGTGWEKDDSVYITYAMFNNIFELQLPSLARNGLVGHLATSKPELPTFQNPLFGPLTGEIFPDLSNSTFSREDHYWNKSLDSSVLWKFNHYNSRSFDNQHLLSDIQTLNADSIPNYNFSNFIWDGDKITGFHKGIALEETTDTFFSYNFIYSGDKIIESDKFAYLELPVPNTKIKSAIVTYSFSDAGLPIEEIISNYEATVENKGGLREKTTYAYNDLGLVTMSSIYLRNNGEWLETLQYYYTFNEDKLVRSTTLYRSIDTSKAVPEISAWDTINDQNYYWSHGRLDSVISFQDLSPAEDLTFCFSERYYYNGYNLESYLLDYADNNSFEDVERYYTYDAGGRKTEAVIYYSGDDYLVITDSVYTYNENGSIDLIEYGYRTPIPFTDEYEVNFTNRKKFYYEDQVIAGVGSDDLYLQVYPSPATDNLTITVGTQSGATLFIALNIFTSDGKLVQYESFPLTESTTIQIDCSTWAKGVYYVSVKNGSSVAYQKIVKM